MKFKKYRIKNEFLFIKFKIIKYPYLKNMEIEIFRKKKFDELKNIFKSIFETDKEVIDLFSISYCSNYNSEDPVISTDIPKKYFDFIFEENTDSDKCKKFNLSLKKKVKSIKEFNKMCKKNHNSLSSVSIYKKENRVELSYKNGGHGSVITNIVVPRNTYNKMYKRLDRGKLDDENINYKIMLVCFRYQYIGYFTGMQGALLPQKYNILINKFNCSLEMFASAFNSTCKYYCGLFFDIESSFRCIGNVFNTKLVYGFVTANPPYDNFIMNRTFKMLILTLRRALTNNKKITVLMILPVWDQKDRILLNKKCQKKLKLDYSSPFKINIIRKNKKFVKYDRLWCKENYRYFSYVDDKEINYAPTNMIVLSSVQLKVNIDTLLKNHTPDLVYT